MKTSKIKVEIDWEGYFKKFIVEHSPPEHVHYDDKLLFHDGWMYNALSKAGPEYPPPKDSKKLKGLLNIFWRARRKLVKEQINELQSDITRVRELQSTRSIGLTEIVRDIDTGERKVVLIDLEMKEGRLHWLKSDLEICDSKLKEIETWQRQKKTDTTKVGSPE